MAVGKENLELHDSFWSAGDASRLLYVDFVAGHTLSTGRNVPGVEVRVWTGVPGKGYYKESSQPDDSPERVALVDRVEATLNSWTSEDPLVGQGMRLTYESYPPLDSSNPEDYRKIAERATGMLTAAATVRFEKVEG